MKYVYEQASIYRTFNEIDLHEVEYFHKLIQEMNKNKFKGVDRSFI